MSALQSISGRATPLAARPTTSSWSAPALPACTCCTGCAGSALSVRVYEQGGDVGGTWYWNRYPGARCDVESMQYSYSFSDELQQEWDWSERYAPQPEILRYANHVADRFDLRRDIQFNTRLDGATFDEATGSWSVTTSDGNRAPRSYVVLATGCLSNARMPGFQGPRATSRARSTTPATGRIEPVDFTGQRVGVIGTGSSAIQSVPVIAEQASHLTVFQRTANFSHSRPQRRTDRDEERERWRADYPEIRRFAREEIAQRHRTPRCPTAARSTTATTSGAPTTKRAGAAAA